MKRFKSSVSYSSSITLAALLALPLGLGASACELLVRIDPSQIPQEEGAVGGSSAGGGGDSSSGGTTSGGQPQGGRAGASTSGGEAGEVSGDAGAAGADSSVAGAGEETGGHGGASGNGNVSGSGGVSANGGSAPHGGAGGNGNVSGSGGVSANGGTTSGGASGGGASGTSGASGGGASGGGVSGSSGVSGAGGAGGGGPAGKIIYLTGTPKKANFGGVSGADTLCNASPPSPGSYKALIVDGTTRVACTSAHCVTSGAAEGVDWVLAPNTKYVRADNTVVGTTSAAAIFAFPLTNSVGEIGYSYWTGLSGDWTTSTDTCNAWTEVSVVGASQGLADTLDSQSISGVVVNCGDLAGAFFACVQQ
ncbi:MAG TPA: DUF1554 domain-containing protein [Polyangiaceae bacterium]|nr:DUF1554 domain-containing protein [Polyangiaceae bacterium]